MPADPRFRAVRNGRTDGARYLGKHTLQNKQDRPPPGVAIAVVGMAFATASWASITSSENPSADGSYTVSWSAVPNAHSYQLYEGGTLVHDGTGTSRSFSGKATGSYRYTLEFCEFTFDEEFCDLPSGYAALTVTVSAPPGKPTLTVPATDPDGDYKVSWTSPSGATRYALQEKVGSAAWSASESLTTTTKSYSGKTPAIYTYRVRRALVRPTAVPGRRPGRRGCRRGRRR